MLVKGLIFLVKEPKYETGILQNSPIIATWKLKVENNVLLCSILVLDNINEDKIVKYGLVSHLHKHSDDSLIYEMLGPVDEICTGLDGPRLQT